MKVFVSYAHEYRPQAEEIVALLRQAGHEVFYDKQRLEPGRSYTADIHDGIEQADLFLFLLGPASLEPGCYARHELEVAEATWPDPSDHVLPVVVEEPDAAAVSPWLRSVTWCRPRGSLGPGVLHAVHRLLARRPASWVRHLLRGRGPTAVLLVVLLAALPAAMLAGTGLAPPWPDSDLLLLALAWFAEIVGFLLVLFASRHLASRARTATSLLLLAAFGATFVLFVQDVGEHVQSIGHDRVLVLPVDRENLRSDVYTQLERAVEEARRDSGEIAGPGYETLEAAFDSYRRAGHAQPEECWKREAISAVETRLLLLWAASFLLAAAFAWMVVVRPPSRG